MGALVRNFTPATPWRAFFVFALAVMPVFAGPPPTATPPSLAQVGKPNAAEAARILDQFRHSGWVGYVEFDLHALPRRGDETVYHGRLWGGSNEQGAVTRIEVTDGHGAVHRWLLQNGDRAAVWELANGKVATVDIAAWFRPLIPGVEITAFDLEMPFLYWSDVRVDSVTRVRGRPAYEFLFRPPVNFTARYPQIALVRAFFDAQFNAPLQVELANDHAVTKTTSLVDLKRVGEQTVPKSFDVRNEATRDKTRFEVTAVALNLEFPSTIFAPAALVEDVRPPAADRIVRIGE
jgi:hypothetical protein